MKTNKLFNLGLFIFVALSGCDANSTKVAPPSKLELDAAFDRAAATLNQKTNSQIKRIEFGWIEVPESCYSHLDYYAQQVLWAAIYHEELIKEKEGILINCDGADFYEQ